MYEKFKINEKVEELSVEVENELTDIFKNIPVILVKNQMIRTSIKIRPPASLVKDFINFIGRKTRISLCLQGLQILCL